VSASTPDHSIPDSNRNYIIRDRLRGGALSKVAINNGYRRVDRASGGGVHSDKWPRFSHGISPLRSRLLVFGKKDSAERPLTDGLRMKDHGRLRRDECTVGFRIPFDGLPVGVSLERLPRGLALLVRLELSEIVKF
jgi:hypothetical protein